MNCRNSFGCIFIGIAAGAMVFQSVLGERHLHTLEKSYDTTPTTTSYTIVGTATISGTNLR